MVSSLRTSPPKLRQLYTYQRPITHNILRAFETRYLHVPVLKYINFHALTHQRERHQDRIITITSQSKMNARLL